MRKTDGSRDSSRLSRQRRASSLALVENIFQECIMIRRKQLIVISALIAFAAHANAGPSAVSPALAACSKALVESIRAEPLPVYTVKSPGHSSAYMDPNSFTVLAHNKKTKELLAKASCRATAEGEIVEFKAYPVKS
jgi:hypothetical protein